MRLKQSVLVASLAALAAVPCLASIKAMSLAELMGMTTDTVKVRILDKHTFKLDTPSEGAVYTRLTVEGESLRTGAPVATDVVFLGSHDPADNYSTSITPLLQDTRVGNEAVIFYSHDTDMPGVMNRISDLSCVYRIESSFGSPVVIGKGEGAPVPENIKLADLHDQVRAIHAAQQASRTGNGK